MAAAAATPLTLQISSETAPPGGYVQFKISPTVPTLIASGSLTMNLDPSIFGPVGQLAVFSATGDQIGYANVNGEHLDVHFSSPSAGLGQLPQLPVFTVSLPVLATAKPGSTASITATAGTGWNDADGNKYAVTVTPGTFTVGGSLSIRSLTPGGGLLSAGTEIQLAGTGFDLGTSVAIDGVNISATVFVNSSEITLMLGGTTEITGKHVHMTSSDGEQADYYAAPPSAPLDADSLDGFFTGVHAILPLTTYTASQTGNSLGGNADSMGFAMFNPSLTPVTITLAGFTPTNQGNQLLYVDTFSVPASQLYFIDASQPLRSLGLSGQLWVTSTAPVRFINFRRSSFVDPSTGQPLTTLSPPTPVTGPEPPIEVELTPSTNAVSFSSQAGGPPPAPATVTLSGNFAFNTSVSPNASQWLSVSSLRNASSSTLTLTANPAGLNAGSYSGTVTVSPVAPDSLTGVPVVPAAINVTLTVTNSPMISYSSLFCCDFVAPGTNQPAGPAEMLTVLSNGNPAQVTVSVLTGSGGNWLNVTPLSGTTPLQLTVTANPVGLNLAPANYSGQITIQGPANTVTTTVLLHVLAPPPHGTTLMVNGPAPAFALPAGTAQSRSAASFISFKEFDVALTSVETNVPWLSAVIETSGPSPPASINLYPNSVGLSLGVYSGAITINSSNYPALTVPATLTVIAAPNAQTMLTATPAALSFTAPASSVSASQSLAISFSSNTPVQFNLLGVPPWLQIQPAPAFTTAAPVYTMTASSGGLSPGTYYAGLVINWTTGSITVPITFSVTSTSAFPPIIAAIVNSASETPGALAPGEIIGIFGTGLGGVPAGAQLDDSGSIATNIGKAQVLIGGIAAPLIYASASQVNAVVPYEVGTSGTAAVQVNSGSVASDAWEVPVGPAAAAIFTDNATGIGQAAVLNQDSSINNPSNPAARGSTIQIFATGGGQTLPASVTGALATSAENLQESVQMTIGGVNAMISYAGSAPGEINGLIQINAVVPQSVTPGAAIPLVVTIGNKPSPNGATIAVQ